MSESVQNLLILWFQTACVPLALLGFVGLLGWRFRIRVKDLMGLGVGGSIRERPVEPAFPPFPPSPKHAVPPLVSLVLRRFEASEVEPATGQVAAAVFDAEATARSATLAYVAAGLAWISLTSVALTVGMPAMSRNGAVSHWPNYAKWLLVYLLQGPPLFLLVWFVGTSLWTRLATLGGYLLLGLLVVPMAPSFSAVVYVACQISLVVVLGPITGLLLLLARPLRPWLIGLFAIPLYVLAEVMVGFLSGFFSISGFDAALSKIALSGVNPWWWVVIILFKVIAVLSVAWMLRRRRWWIPVAGLTLMLAAGLLLIWLFPKFEIRPLPLTAVFLCVLPLDILQVFVVWWFFKLLVQLQERQFVPAQVLQSHLCWGFLTLYLWVYAFLVLYRGWTPWVVALAYVLYLMVLHALLGRLWAGRVSRPGKRLLLLRVFGRADQREKLLAALDDTWRRIGQIDLIAGTDLATRTLGSRMIEAFLLRRTDKQFLKTAEEVDRRLENLDSRLEGDARYPVNGVYCYANAWQRAVGWLAPKADAVLMDLRGFTNKNQGCVFELRWVVQHIPLSRVVLLTDASSDDQALEAVAQTAWTQLPPGPSNAGLPELVLTILHAPRLQTESRHALFRLLLAAAYR